MAFPAPPSRPDSLRPPAGSDHGFTPESVAFLAMTLASVASACLVLASLSAVVPGPGPYLPLWPVGLLGALALPHGLLRLGVGLTARLRRGRRPRAARGTRRP